jgi:hypothetical protein
MSPRYRALVSEPPPDHVDIVRIVESSDSSPAKCVQYGYVKPLVDWLRRGSPTAECKAAADWIERFAEDIRYSAWMDFKGRVCVAYVFGLRPEWRGRPRAAVRVDKTVVGAVKDKLGRARDFVYEALSKYWDDPECQAAKFHVPSSLPADLLEDLRQARKKTDPLPMSRHTSR